MLERIGVYEWCCSGGASAVRDGPVGLEEAIRSEGRAMFLAVLGDAASDPRHRVTAFLADEGPVSRDDLPVGIAIRRIDGRWHDDALVAAAVEQDWLLLIAPETDGELARLASLVRAAGGRVALPSAAFIELASNKHASLLALAGAGLPVPAGRLLAPGESPPTGFRLPAIRKANASAGCDGLSRIDSAAHLAGAAATSERLEARAEGRPVGVAVLCGPGGMVPLPPCEQVFEGARRPAYRGGHSLEDRGLAARATALARRAVSTLEDRSGFAAGWVGVDMILGPRADGRGDRVLEVNPRLTTSFVGLAAAAGKGLTRMILDAAEGRLREPIGSIGSCTFTTTGRVWVDAR